MRYSNLFTKTRRDAPSDEVSKNAQLLIRGGFIHKEMAGVYDFLPLGLRVLRKIEQIIREEINAIEGQELLLTTLQNPDVWQKSGRWIDEQNGEGGLPWFKTQLSSGTELGIATTHEEALANIATHHISSYKDIPFYAYQFQNKFRNELRAKSGIMRGREFLMKDLYSFTRTQEDLEEYYERAAQAYMNIFDRVGIGDLTFRTFASGGAFSKFSDEFQTLSEAGEDTIYLDRDKQVAVNEEVYTDDVIEELGLEKSELEEVKSIEVGNIFKLGTKFAEAEELFYTDENGNQQPVVMGSYGIGVGRVMGTVVEVLSDENGIVWPKSVAPFDVHIVSIGNGSEVTERAENLYKDLQSAGREVFYDDRDESPGSKLNDADLIGIPIRLVVSSRTLQNESVEYKERTDENSKEISFDNIVQHITNN